MGVKKELKYPIKYAIMPIKERSLWYLNFKGDDVVANIVSKCYVISTIKEYSSDGTFKVKYKVVFPYIKTGTAYNAVEPNYNNNSIVVNQLFDSFGEAKLLAVEENREILKRNIGILPLDEDLQDKVMKLRKSHQQIIDGYKEQEEMIEKNTSDMTITKTFSPTLEHLIDQALECPSEFYVKLAGVLTSEEKKYLKQFIETRDCSNCTNDSCFGENCEKVGFDETGKLQGNVCLNWNNDELIGRQRVLSRNI